MNTKTAMKIVNACVIRCSRADRRRRIPIVLNHLRYDVGQKMASASRKPLCGESYNECIQSAKNYSIITGSATMNVMNTLLFNSEKHLVVPNNYVKLFV
uniref:Phage protein n=1 Tax=Heterorhabditis bacteriophora TaxID=37862 RepID=A0A1I7XF37_HETBA